MTSKPPEQPDSASAAASGVAAVLPDDVRRFLLASVSSIPYLEALLLLRSQPETQWSARQVAQRLYVNEKRAQELLAELEDAGVVGKTLPDGSQFRYQPASGELRQMLDGLAEVYAHHLVEVTHLIHSRGDKREQRAQKFADAFRWRKDA
ncbi:hypothetical protein [Polaromonas sp.]|uniref:hypothetical protein n=1 Tax=Polaromonas sp. TaxID=1869339 RepID=UPI003C934F61